VVHSLPDGPSLAGAFRLAIARTTGTLIKIENHLFARRDIERLGIWFSEYGRERLADWRPEVHDADALVIWNGAGERLFAARLIAAHYDAQAGRPVDIEWLLTAAVHEPYLRHMRRLS
jgi:glucan biosynthesis protein